jgi:hypothetical protein
MGLPPISEKDEAYDYPDYKSELLAFEQRIKARRAAGSFCHSFYFVFYFVVCLS